MSLSDGFLGFNASSDPIGLVKGRIECLKKNHTLDENGEDVFVCIDGERLPQKALQALKISERLEGKAIRKIITATIRQTELGTFAWDYWSEFTVFRNEQLAFTGGCLRAEIKDDGSLELTLEGLFAELERALIKDLIYFGMGRKEQMYFSSLMAGAKGVHVPDFVPESKKRPFLYAVPITDLKVTGDVSSLHFNDVGITAGESDTTFSPIIGQVGLDTKDPLWGAETPKVYGVVFACDLLEAEGLARRKA